MFKKFVRNVLIGAMVGSVLGAPIGFIAGMLTTRFKQESA